MSGTDTLTAAHTSGLVSPQPCYMRAHRGNVFDELFELRLIPELLATAVWARTELDLNILIDRIGLVPEGARMSGRTPRPLGRDRPFSWLPAGRRPLTASP